MTSLEEVTLELRSIRAELRQLTDRLKPLPMCLSFTAAALQLSISVATIKRMVRDGRLPTVTLGRRRLVPQTEIEHLARPTAPSRRPARGPGGIRSVTTPTE